MSYSFWVTPEYDARMRSGWVAATASMSMPSVSSKSTGVSASISSSFSSTQGRTPSSSSSPQLAALMPTGTTPRASGTSWLAQATAAIRSGWDSMVVSPRACWMVTGKTSPVAEDDDEVPSAELDGAGVVVPAGGEGQGGGERGRGGQEAQTVHGSSRESR